MSKGSWQRPTDREAYEAGWERVFGSGTSDTVRAVNDRLRRDLDEQIQGQDGDDVRVYFDYVPVVINMELGPARPPGESP